MTLTARQWDVLEAVAELYPRSVEATDVFYALVRGGPIVSSPAGVSATLAALAHRELVHKRRDWTHTWKGGRPSRLRDRRATLYEITTTGRELLRSQRTGR